MAKITIDYGHTLSGADTGASGCGKKEQDLTREVGTRVVSLLRSVGNEVHEIRKDSCSSLNESLNWRVNTINSINPDYSVSIHFNSFNGSAHGSEVWIGTGVNDKADRILSNLSKLGLTNRGKKDGIGRGLALVKRTNPPAMLIECCFIDNQGDMSKYNADKFARAIANGIDTRVALEEPKKEEPLKHFKIIMYGGFNVNKVRQEGIDFCSLDMHNGETLESIAIQIEGFNFQYRVNISQNGRTPWLRNGYLQGCYSNGQGIEALEMKNFGEPPYGYQIQYRVHVLDKGWSNWCKDGEFAGNENDGAKRVSAVEVRIVKIA